MTKDFLAATSAQMVQMDSIDGSSGLCCMSFARDIRPLILSIQKVGLLNSPILLDTENTDRMVIISGYRRIQALQYLNVQTFPCRVFPASALEPLDCLLINLYDNLSTRELNPIEMAIVLAKLKEMVIEETLVENYLPLLGLAPRRDVFLFYTKIECELSDSGKMALAEGRLSLQAIKMLLDLEETERDAILKFFSNFMFNMNQQRQLIDFIVDISTIEGRSISSLLQDPSIKQIETDEVMNAPQKAKVLMKWFRKRRLPSVVEAETRFKKGISDLKLPSRVRVISPPFFESSDYTMEISFRDGRQLVTALKDLSSRKNLSNIGNPWEKK